MRTTLTIDDELAEALKEAAYRSKKSFEELINETLALVSRPDSGLEKPNPTS